VRAQSRLAVDISTPHLTCMKFKVSHHIESSVDSLA
jgi:hypothetical protein